VNAILLESERQEEVLDSLRANNKNGALDVTTPDPLLPPFIIAAFTGQAVQCRLFVSEEGHGSTVKRGVSEEGHTVDKDYMQTNMHTQSGRPPSENQMDGMRLKGVGRGHFTVGHPDKTTADQGQDQPAPGPFAAFGGAAFGGRGPRADYRLRPAPVALRVCKSVLRHRHHCAPPLGCIHMAGAADGLGKTKAEGCASNSDTIAMVAHPSSLMHTLLDVSTCPSLPPPLLLFVFPLFLV
jgi:hypothetical protein